MMASIAVSHLSVKLSPEEIRTLERQRYLDGKVWRVADNREFPLKIYVKAGWRAEPIFSGHEIVAYEIDIFPAVIERLKGPGTSSCSSPPGGLRYVYVDREGAI